MPKVEAPFSSFSNLDIRVGTITAVIIGATSKPTYRMEIDFGPEIGVKRSCGAYRKYSVEQLVGKQVIAIINFAPKKMGPELSEVLVLGVPDGNGGTVYLTPAECVASGAVVF